jgi:hypothetical protein
MTRKQYTLNKTNSPALEPQRAEPVRIRYLR